jgi:hypothetical protein
MVACGVLLFLSLPALASTISIEIAGLNVSYDGADIKTTGGVDPLNAVTFELDNVSAGPVLTGSISADLLVPSVLNIDKNGDSVISGAGGFLNLAFPSGDFLDLDLDPATVQYLNLGPGIFHFVFVGTAADTSGQSLPYGLVIGDTVSVALAMTISGTPANNGTDLTSFTASGTGTIEGAAVPEPTTLAVLALAAVGLAGYTQRR